MAPTDITISSLTSEPDDLTLLHAESGLPTAHQMRRTTEGFLIEASRLPSCIPLPASKKPPRSWVWDQGIALGKAIDGDIYRHWLCKICYNNGAVRHPLAHYLLLASDNTTKVINHLEQRHGFDRKGKQRSPTAKKRKKNDLQEVWSRQVEVHHTTFDREGWKEAYIAWVVCSGISLREASASYHNKLLAFQNLRVEQILPTSHMTTTAWILQAYEDAKVKVSESLSKRTSGLTISFDGWKANNEVLELLGIVAHYLDEHYCRRAVVLGLRDTFGSHTGANMADQISTTLKDFSVKEVDYFIADNATNNDKALEVLIGMRPQYCQNKVTQRLRCVGHVYNLVCKAILYGVDSECLEDASQASQTMTKVSSFEAVMNGGDDASKLKAWRTKGPIGKLHNTVLHIKHNGGRRSLFESKQRDANASDGSEDSPAEQIYRVVVNGGIRWNSTYLMIERAMKLKDAIHLYQDDLNADCDTTDYLTAEDWRQLADLKALLAPIYKCSLRVQEASSPLYDVLTTMDFVLTHLESAKAQAPDEATYYKACVNLGWSKLDEYYCRTDLNPAYIMAVFLHPHYRLPWFKAKWDAREFNKVVAVINDTYLTAKEKYGRPAPPPPARLNREELDDFDAYNRLSSPCEDEDDDLQRYLGEKSIKFGIDPLDWWVANEHRYPVLKHLAFTYLATPSSTATNERLFSMAGNVVNEERPRTQAQLAQAVQCLRSWEGLKRSSRP
jgi:hypothetical protein